MSSKSVDLAAAVKKLREESGLTQVQLANRLGIAPTSVYRYEAGSSAPDLKLVQKLLALAVKLRLPTATKDLSEALSERTAIDLSLQRELDERQGFIDSAMTRLRPHEQVLVMAFIKMLREKKDDVTDRITRALLEPFITAAEEEMSQSRDGGSRPVKQVQSVRSRKPVLTLTAE